MLNYEHSVNFQLLLHVQDTAYVMLLPWKNKTRTPGKKHIGYDHSDETKFYYKIIYVLHQFGRVENRLPSINSCMGFLGMQVGEISADHDILILRVNFDCVSLKWNLCISCV